MREVSTPTQIVVALFVISLSGVVGYTLYIVLVACFRVCFIFSHDDGLESLQGHQRTREYARGISQKKKKKKQHSRPGQSRDGKKVSDDHARIAERSCIPSNGMAPVEGKSLKSLQKLSLKHRSSSNHMKRHESNLYMETLKGHTDAVLGISWASSSDEDACLVTACADRYLRVYSIGPTNGRTKSRCTAQHVIRGGIFDVYCCRRGEALCVGFMTYGPHASVEFHMAEIESLHSNNSSFHLLDTKPKIFAPKIGFGPLCLVGSHAAGCMRCIAASSNPRVALFDWNPSDSKIVELGNFDTNSMVNNDAAVSPDGSMFAVGTFSPDVGMYKIQAGTAAGRPLTARKVASLVGHKKKVTSVCFSPCGTKIVTSSEDYTLRIWNINVRHELEEDPKCLRTVGLPSQHPIRRMSWKGDSIAVACHCDVYIFDSSTGKVKYSIIQAHDATINCLEYFQRDDTSILATGGDDCCVKLWCHA